MNKYMVKRRDGTLLVVAAERHREHDGQILFDIRNWDQRLPGERQWLTVASVAQPDVDQLTIVRPSRPSAADT